MGTKYQRQNGEKLADFRKRVVEAEKAEHLQALVNMGVRHTPGPKRYRPHNPGYMRRVDPDRVSRDRNADHVDGYDRDDLGESPDF